MNIVHFLFVSLWRLVACSSVSCSPGAGSEVSRLDWREHLSAVPWALPAAPWGPQRQAVLLSVTLGLSTEVSDDPTSLGRGHSYLPSVYTDSSEVICRRASCSLTTCHLWCLYPRRFRPALPVHGRGAHAVWRCGLAGPPLQRRAVSALFLVLLEARALHV